MTTILVVEDELDVQKVVAKRLASRGFTVHIAHPMVTRRRERPPASLNIC